MESRRQKTLTVYIVKLAKTINCITAICINESNTIQENG